jgi:hypothetical protein
MASTSLGQFLVTLAQNIFTLISICNIVMKGLKTVKFVRGFSVTTPSALAISKSTTSVPESVGYAGMTIVTKDALRRRILPVLRRIISVRQLSGYSVRRDKKERTAGPQVLTCQAGIKPQLQEEVTATTDQIISSTDSELDKCIDKDMVRFKTTV